jgi:hypothetical protein
MVSTGPCEPPVRPKVHFFELIALFIEDVIYCGRVLGVRLTHHFWRGKNSETLQTLLA